MRAIVVCSVLALCFAAQVQDSLSPVTRVVTLLKNLGKQIEEEGKKEEDLYETFVCWGKSVIDQKTESNGEAQTRIDALEQYVSDLDSGKIELTTERQDLEKEIEELTADLDAAKAMRDKEKKDYDGAKDEMDKAIKALGSAIKLLKDATAGNKKGALIAYHSELTGGMAVLEAESANLNQAVELGERFLTKADAEFLRRVITGEVPKRSLLQGPPPAKKATFKMAYKSRSGKIQGVLAKLKSTFEKNLADATSKENDSLGIYKKLSGSKGASLAAANKAYKSMATEGGARGLSKTNAQDEIKALKKQQTDDGKFIKQTQTSLDTKKKEWDTRTKLRDGELGAISKAVNILYNDDARDLMKKSYDSQGFFFLQTSSQKSQSRILKELNNVARRTGDSRISAIAALVADPSAKLKFKPVLKAIDKMLVTLASDEKKDLSTKEECEKDRMDNTRKALLLGNDIDDKTDSITKLESEIEDLKEEIAKLLAEKQRVKDELAKADGIRKEENAAWKVTNKDDGDAAQTVADASKVLKSYYTTAFKLFLNQKSAIPTVVEGEAPPPPPTTWGGGYGGKKGESTGIMSILEMVREDILKDQKKAKEEEGESQKDFDQFKKDSEASMKELQKEADKLTGVKGGKQTDRTDDIKARKTKADGWKGVMKTMSDAAPECEYYAVNFKLRADNRAIEVDGLNKAKAILKGGSFK